MKAISKLGMPIAIGFGAAVVVLQATARLSGPGLVTVAIVAGGIAISALVLAGPMACIGSVLACYFTGFNPPVLNLALVQVGVADIFVFGVLSWAIYVRLGRTDARTPRPVDLRLWPLGLLAGYIGLSVLYVWLVEPADIPRSAVAASRFLITLSLAWLVPATIRDRRDVVRVLGIAALAGCAGVATALVFGVLGGSTIFGTGRFGGFFDPNTLGLVAALLLLFGVAGPIRSVPARVGFFAFGVLGLVLSKSVGGAVSATVMLVLAAVLAKRPVTSLRRKSLLGLALAAVIVLMGFLFVRTFRPEVLSQSVVTAGGSTSHRLVLGRAGWELFVQHPLTGVGWQRSSVPHVIGATDVSEVLRSQFGGLPENYFPDVNPGSVHNAYIHVLAELGVGGLVILLVLLFVIGSDIRRIARQPLSTQDQALVRFLALGIVGLLVWWNDNALFGGQTEIVALAIFLGSLRTIARKTQVGPVEVPRPSLSPAIRARTP